jgi:serine/threonine protein kinase
MKLGLSTDDDGDLNTPTDEIIALQSPVAQRVLGNRYQVRRLIGRGGMSDVYLGDDLLLQRAVAIKMLRSDLAKDSAGLERFRLEATSLAALKSPHVVSIYDIGLEPNGVYLVMEHLVGKTLDQEVARSGTMLQPRAESVLLQVLSGLAAMHAQGLVHRDIKPANVLLDEGDHAVLLDLGIVFDTRRARAPITPPGMVPGTPGYIAPENRLRLETELSSDVYQVGLLMLFLFTGVDFGRRRLSTPFEGYVERLPPHLTAVAKRALATDPVERFPSAMAMKEVVEAAMRRPVLDVQATVTSPQVKTVNGEYQMVARRLLQAGTSIRRDERTTTEISASHLLSLLAEASPSTPPTHRRVYGGLKTAELQASQILGARPDDEALARRHPRVRMEVLRPAGLATRGRVMVVDDDADAGATLRRMLLSEHDVDVAGDVRDALKRIDGGERFDVIVCDVRGPNEFYAAVLARCPHQACTIIFITEKDSVEGARSLGLEHKNRKIAKPFEIGVLRSMIQERLEPYRQVTA